ncbi:unnamed protein product, partial [Didymodactylos carnosus]
YNDPKELGSSGFLPALQTYLCRANNTCWLTPLTTDNAKSFGFLQMISNVSDTLSVLFQNNDTASSIDRLYKLLSEINSIAHLLSTYWNGYISVSLPVQSFNDSISNETLNTLFTNSISLINLHQNWLVNDEISQTKTNVEVMIKIVLQSIATYQNPATVKTMFCTNKQFENTFQFEEIQQTARDVAKSELCDLSDSDLLNFLISLKKQLDDLFLTVEKYNTRKNNDFTYLFIIVEKLEDVFDTQ